MQNNEQLQAAHRTENFRLTNIGLVMLFIALLVLTALFMQQERSNMVNAELDQRLSWVARTTAENLGLSVENLHSAANIMVFFEDISYSQFMGITTRNLATDPGLIILEWQPVVSASDREAFVNKTRSQGLPDFSLWEPDVSGKPVPAGARPVHVPVHYMVSKNPEPGMVDTLGLDMAWSTERMKSKWEARDLGRAQSSELFRIITGPESNFRPLGFAITLPVYKRGFVPGTLDSRRADLLGYMAGVYAVRELLKEQIDELVAAGFSIDIHDHMDNENRLVIEAGTASIHSKEIDIDLFGNNLHFRLIATEDFVSSQFHPLWVTLPSALIVFGALIFVFLHQLEKKNNRLANAQVELHKLNERLEELSRLDPLTSLFNRRAFIEAMNQELGRMQRHQGSLALLMLDLDHFKQINDRWGHPAGDKMLVEFSRVCRESSRNIDILGRLGGEEFAILLVETDREEALQFAERLRKRVSELSVRVNEEGAETGFTVSIGLSQIDQPMAVNKWVEQADKALYWAKHSGRDCVREYDA